MAEHPVIIPRHGGSPQMGWLPEASTQSFVAGNLLNDSSAKAEIKADNATTMIGIAVAPASGVTDTVVWYQMIEADDVLEMSFTGTLAKQTAYGITASSGVHIVDASNTDDVVVFEEYVIRPGETAATATRGKFRVLNSALSLHN